MQIIATDATNFREPLEIYDADGNAATGLTHASAITFAYRGPSDADWVAVSAVAGSSTHTDGGFRSLGGNVYEFCWPNAVVVANESTLLRYIYDGKTHYDVVSARLASETSRVITVPQTVRDDILDTTLASITRYRGSEWVIAIEGISDDDFTRAIGIVFSVKDDDVVDTAALVFVRADINAGSSTEGLIYLNGASATANQGAITHESYTEEGATLHRFIATIEGEATAQIAVNAGFSGQFADSAGTPYVMGWKLVGEKDTHFDGGTLTVRPDVPRATS